MEGDGEHMEIADDIDGPGEEVPETVTSGGVSVCESVGDECIPLLGCELIPNS